MAEYGVTQPWDLQGPTDEATVPGTSIISNARKIPDAEWQLYKEEIRVLYMEENKTLEEAMATMETTHGFKASKAQYIRKLDKWGLKKHSTKEKWEYISQKLQKRKLEGKESDTFINGKLVPLKKVKKETSRHALPSWQIMGNTGQSPLSLIGIEIRTPPHEHVFFVEYLHIPWFEFETLVEPQIIRLRSLAHMRNVARSLAYEHATGIPNGSMTWIPPPQPTIARDQWLHQTTLSRSPRDGEAQRLGVSQNAQTNPSTQIQEDPLNLVSPSWHDGEARSIFANILGQEIESHRSDYLSTITSHLDNIFIERHDGDISRNVQRFLGSTDFEIALQLLHYSVYFSSNHLLNDRQIDQLLRWVIRNDRFAAVEYIINLKTATSLIFASNILQSAIRIESYASVQALIALGIDINLPGGAYRKKTALSCAIDLRLQRHGDTEGRLSLVRLLLEAGAEISQRSSTSALQEAVKMKDVELIQLIFNFGVVRTALRNEFELPYANLFQAAKNRDSALMKGLLDTLDTESPLDPLTQPYMITLLQDAARWNVLLDAGAKVDGYLLTEEEALAHEIIAATDIKVDNWSMDSESFRSKSEDGYRDDDIDADYAYIDNSHSTWTPLQSAVWRKDGAMALILLGASANVEGLGRGPTPLQLAVMNNDIKLVKLLPKKGASVNSPSYGFKGRTALQEAVKARHLGMMEILMGAGADINAAAGQNYGRTALQMAAQVESFTLATKLISHGADVNAAASPIRGRTCLQAAAEKGHIELVKLLLDSGAEVNAAAADRFGLTALQAAAKGGHLAVVEILLTAGAIVQAPGAKGGCSAVSAAVEATSLEMVQLFLITGSPDGHADEVPPLLRASIKGATEIVRCLIHAGANINAPRTDGQYDRFQHYPRTALEVSLYYGHEDIFKILFDAGANANGQALNMGAALGAALLTPFWETKVKMEIIHKLLDAGADVNTPFLERYMPLPCAVMTGNIKLVELFLNAGAGVDSRTGPRGDTLLVEGVRLGRSDVIEILLDAEADINEAADEKHGRTAPQAAAERGNTSLVRLLLQRGADCNAPPADWYGVTALQAAAIKGHLPATLTLLQAGVDINAPGARVEGRTALEGAAEHGRLDIVSLLLRNDSDRQGLETWNKVIDGKFIHGKNIGREELDELMGDCMVVSGVPCHLFLDEMLAAYPDAKVILTTRDIDAWYSSIMNSFNYISTRPIFRVASLFDTFIEERQAYLDRVMHWGYYDNLPVFGKLVHKNHVEKVRTLVEAGKIKKENFLELQVGHGWEPLCDFLGIDGPGGKKYPRVNDLESVRTMFSTALIPRAWWVAFRGIATYAVPIVALGGVWWLKRRNTFPITYVPVP
ncbi:hypothetical protein EG329_002894 [Mollisiaceae sp. DMI_Dod_QoI]|nr:hypothetical protein EG329_002894 [Helotiales sp. DMI_Dod_QoI]